MQQLTDRDYCIKARECLITIHALTFESLKKKKKHMNFLYSLTKKPEMTNQWATYVSMH